MGRKQYFWESLQIIKKKLNNKFDGMLRLIWIVALFITLGVSAHTNQDDTYKAISLIREGNMNEGVEILKSLSNSNNRDSQFYLGECFEYGIGMNVDYERAFELYRKTAERGLPDAMWRLSEWYKEGIYVPKNLEKSKEWQSRFNKKGGENTLINLQEILFQGSHIQDNSFDNPAGLNFELSYYHPNQEPLVNRNSVKKNTVSEIDINIPTTNETDHNLFALIIANENYLEVEDVTNAINDGKIMAEYCKKTLGIPEENIHLVKNATLNNIKREIALMEQIAETYKGDANFIIYYAGHGIPDITSGNSYILPVDGYLSDLSTCYALSDFYAKIGDFPSQKLMIFIDACFSGSLRGNGMLQTARGVVLKAKSGNLKGNMVVFSAAQGDETAFPLEKENHGLFTYWLLKNIQDSKGNISLGDLSEKIIDSVSKHSLIANGKKQTPTVQVSPKLKDTWRNWKLSDN